MKSLISACTKQESGNEEGLLTSSISFVGFLSELTRATKFTHSNLCNPWPYSFFVLLSSLISNAQLLQVLGNSKSDISDNANTWEQLSNCSLIILPNVYLLEVICHYAYLKSIFSQRQVFVIVTTSGFLVAEFFPRVVYVFLM